MARDRKRPLRFSLASLLIGLAGCCTALAAIPAFIVSMGGIPDPGRQSDFFFEIILSQVCGSCCILVVICLVTLSAIASVSSRDGNSRPD